MPLDVSVIEYKCDCGKPTVQHDNFVEALCRECHAKDLELWAKQNGY